MPPCGRWNRRSSTRAGRPVSPSSRSSSPAIRGPTPGSAEAGANSGSRRDGRRDTTHQLWQARAQPLYSTDGACPTTAGSRRHRITGSEDGGIMSGMTRTSADLDPRRRRILFRAWHRGIREMDLILGRFADAAIDALSEPELDAFEQLIEVPDRDL